MDTFTDTFTDCTHIYFPQTCTHIHTHVYTHVHSVSNPRSYTVFFRCVTCLLIMSPMYDS